MITDHYQIIYSDTRSQSFGLPGWHMAKVNMVTEHTIDDLDNNIILLEVYKNNEDYNTSSIDTKRSNQT